LENRPVPLLLLLLLQQPAAPWPGDTWPIATPASQGLRAELFEAIDNDVRAGVYGHVDRLFVTRHGRAVFDRTYPRDYAGISRDRVSPIGCGAGCTDPSRMHQYNYFHPTWHPLWQGRPVHSLQSVTKSVAATLVGIAIGRGEVTPPNRPFLPYFTDYDLARVDPRLHRSTLHDLLTMRSGIEWHEHDRPLDITNTTFALELTADWIQFTLDQPMDADPGTKWVYNSGGSHLMSGIIRQATGQFIDDYAREHLFGPIGIRDFHWKRTPSGHPDTEGGLYLGAEDLARIGYLYLRDGMWNGRRVLPEGWVAGATSRHTTANAAWDYGYQWWIMQRGGAEVWAGRGFGGQLLLVVPSRDVVAVVLAWNVFGGAARNPLGPLLDAILGE
jgi:hypothetical protein